MRQYYGYPPYGYYPYPYSYPYYGYYRSRRLLPFFFLLPFLFRGEDGEDGVRANATTYAAKQGDTMGGIAEEQNVPLPILMSANPHIQNPNALNAGDQVNIPNLAKMQCHAMYMEDGHGAVPFMNPMQQQMQMPFSPQQAMPQGQGTATYPPYSQQLPQTSPWQQPYSGQGGGMMQGDQQWSSPYGGTQPGYQQGTPIPGTQQGSQQGYPAYGTQPDQGASSGQTSGNREEESQQS
jgi:LysM repeat protein